MGGFYSIPNFLSTTGNRQLAEIFAGEGTSIEADSVLFEIDVPKNSRTVAYANISEDSAFGEGENEVLFTMGTVFRIISAEKINERAWLVKLKLSDDENEDEETRQVQLRFKNEIISSNGTMSFARLASRMARYGVAVKFYDLLLQNPPVDDEFIPLSKIHEELGFVYYSLQQYENAIEHYEASIQIDLEEYPVTDRRFFKRCNDLGCAYLANRDFMKAEQILNTAMRIIEDISEPDQTSSEIYVKIIADFFRAKKSDISIVSLNEGEDSPIHKFQSLVEKYPNSLSLGNDIGTVYYVKGNYEKAMEMYELCLANQLSVDRYDPCVARTYSNMGFVHHDTGRYDMAIEFFNKELKILMKNHHSNHLEISGATKAMAICYYMQGDLKQALACWTKVLDMQIYNFSEIHPTVDEAMTWIIRISEKLAPQESEEEST
ncbi:unnamed protein product [Adineta steineri]|uniref:Tetratricopeptide repeat protein n=1 Tax=Adineta steineri TaxID=433720 RepID=A0A814K161_9BILA|nr:unnamed protein product [Adineta steineri]CAF3745461.1 unnamed protein product [Adineta steineri]